MAHTTVETKDHMKDELLADSMDASTVHTMAGLMAVLSADL